MGMAGSPAMVKTAVMIKQVAPVASQPGPFGLALQRPVTDTWPKLHRKGPDIAMKRRSFLHGLTATSAMLLAGGAFAATYAEDVVRQLTKQGFYNIAVDTTWLGRVRIHADRSDGQREIILNPRTGEILRDSWQAAGSGGVTPIIDDVGENSGSGSTSSGGSSSGSGVSGGDNRGGDDHGGDDHGGDGQGGDDTSGQGGSDNSGRGGSDDGGSDKNN